MTGYSGKLLVKKLGIKAGYRCFFMNPPDYYGNLLDGIPEIERCEGLNTTEIDFIHAFFDKESELINSWDQLKSILKKSGMMWVSWPKKSSKMETDLDGNKVREIGLKGGLVDVKVCAVDENWSGLKFMFRIKDR